MSEAVEQAPQPIPSSGSAAKGSLAAIAGWAVPGLGHLILGRWSKAIAYFLTVGALAYTGLAMRGNVFPMHAADVFGRLGFFADASAGVFPYLSRFIETAGPDVSRAAGDDGTRLIAAAGILNLLTVIEAFEIGRGKRV